MNLGKGGINMSNEMTLEQLQQYIVQQKVNAFDMLKYLVQGSVELKHAEYKSLKHATTLLITEADENIKTALQRYELSNTK